MTTEFAARRGLLLVAAGWLAVAAPLLGQSAAPGAAAPTFDVVSIRPNHSGNGMIRMQTLADRYSATGMPMKGLIQFAYNIRMQEQVSGVTGPVGAARFDIEAKMDEETVAALQKLPNEERLAQMRLMMQAMLADRFQLKVHREPKELPVYDLVIAKRGFKLKEADPANTYANGIKGFDGVSHAGMVMFSLTSITTQAAPISSLTGPLTMLVHRMVVDKTGLTGKYDIALKWSRDDSQGPAGQDAASAASAASANAGPSIITALQEQLGLRLESTKGPVDTIVVDHVEMPSEN